MMSDRPAISGIVLAGGRATRMGGIDKGLVPLAGQPLIAHVLARMQAQVDDIVINANRHADIYTRFGYPVIPDTGNDYAGPLAGIAAALPHCQHPWVLVIACDCPLVPENLAASLQLGLQHGDKIAVAHDGKHLQPLFLLLHRSLLPSLQDALAARQLKVESWLLRQARAIVTLSDQEAFRNINTETDRTTLETWLLAQHQVRP